MQILIYNPYNRHIGRVFADHLKEVEPEMICVAENRQAFESKILSCFAGHCIIVFFIRHENELDILKSNESKLFDIRLIISLPNDDQALFSKATTFYPRFIDIRDGSCRRLLSVVDKMSRLLVNQYY